MRDKSNRSNKAKKRRKRLIYGGSGALLLIGILSLAFVAYSPFSPWSYWWVEDTTTTPTTKATSTFTLIDYNTGEDVSDWVEISLWTEDDDDLPFDDKDPFRITNFDEEISSKDANDVTYDLRTVSYAWLEIDPDFESVYGGYNGVDNPVVSNDFRLLLGGKNYDYLVPVYHLPSNISVNVLDRVTSDEWNETSISAGLKYTRNDNGSYVVILDLPHNSTNQPHCGDDDGANWEIDDEEFDDMTATELLWLYDQRNFRSIAPFYDMVDDDDKDYDDDLEIVTNCFAVNFTFNDTVSLVDGELTQVNITLDERDYVAEPAEVVVSGASILIIFYEPILCYPGPYSFDIDIGVSTDINCTSVTTGRIFTPEDDDNLGDWTLINTAPLFDQDPFG